MPNSNYPSKRENKLVKKRFKFQFNDTQKHLPIASNQLEKSKPITIIKKLPSVLRVTKVLFKSKAPNNFLAIFHIYYHVGCFKAI